jgi:hypothetical protein
MTMESKYKFNEAYMLMYYENAETKMGFMVYNTRDGVTPFCVVEDGKEYQHTHWGMDRRPAQGYVEKHILVPGQRIFRDITPEEGKNFAIARLRQAKGTPYEVEEGSEQWNELLASLTEEFSRPGEPIMVKIQKDQN